MQVNCIGCEQPLGEFEGLHYCPLGTNCPLMKSGTVKSHRRCPKCGGADWDRKLRVSCGNKNVLVCSCSIVSETLIPVPA